MADNEPLMDVFVRILPDDDSLKALKQNLDSTVSEVSSTLAKLGQQSAQIAARTSASANRGGKSAEASAADEARKSFDSLRKQVQNDITNLSGQLSSLRAEGLKGDLEGVRNAFREISSLKIDLNAGEAEIEIQDRTEQLLNLRSVLESIQERAVGGAGVGSGAGSALKAARDQAKLLNAEINIAGRELQGVTAPGLKNDLFNAKTELQKLISEMSQLDDATFDATALQPYLDGLRNIRSEVLSVQGATTDAIQNEEKGRIKIALLQQKQKELDVQIRQFQPATIPAKTRIEVREIISELQSANVALQISKNAIDGTALSWQNYAESLEAATGRQQLLLNKFQGIQAQGATFNTLSNNAYQLGQAFEDAAIGYQLNGIAGAVRGASNNVSFLLNDLSRVPAVQERVGRLFGIAADRAKSVIPMVSGIGAALAITVLPAMIEWLQSLDDIEYQLDDLSERLRREFENIDLEVDIRIDEEQFNRGLGKLESVKDILEEIEQLKYRSEEIAFRVSTQIQDLDTGKFSTAFRQQLRDFETELSTRLESIQEQKAIELQLRQQPPVFPGVIPPSIVSRNIVDALNKEFDSVIEITKLLGGIDENIDDIIQKSSRGILDSKQLIQTSEYLQQLQESLTENQELLTKSSKITFDDANNSIGELQNRIDSLVKPAREFESIISEQLSSAVDAISDKTEQLAARQTLFRRQIAGTADEYDEMFLSVSELSSQYEDLIASTLEFYTRSGATLEQIKSLREALSREAEMQIENDILEKQKDVIEKLAKAEERLTELREKREGIKSKEIGLSPFLTAIQEAALSIDETGIDKNTKAMEDLTKEVDRLKGVLEKLNQGQALIDQQGAGVNAAGPLRDLPLLRKSRITEAIEFFGEGILLPKPRLPDGEIERGIRGITPDEIVGAVRDGFIKATTGRSIPITQGADWKASDQKPAAVMGQ